LEEGITEAGAVASWIAAATSYSTHGVPMLPFYIFYSAFGYRRIGDLVWAAGDSRCRGFLIGATAGRTTLAGEGLQHQDGSSHLLFSVVPNCVAYDPCYGYELAAIVQDGMRRMLEDQEDVFYYVTVTNENYVHPAMPEGAQEVLRGLYRLQPSKDSQGGPRVQILGAGTLLREALAAAELLERDWGGGRGSLERHQLHGTAPRRTGRRAAQPAASGRCARCELGRAVSYADRGAGGCRERLPAHGAGSHSRLGAAPLRHLGHRRVRAQRYPRRVAPLL
jgi:hypothetical protein